MVPTGEVDIAKLSADSSPGDLVYAFGRCLGNVTATFNNIHNYVTWLRSQYIRLDTPELMDQVKKVFAEAHIGDGATSESRDRYARYLRSLLSCEALPQHFSVTTGVIVPCYNIGDAVDGQFVVGGKKDWFAGVVVDTRSPRAALSYEVFWIGSMPKKQGGSKNPSWVSVHSLRSHVEGSLTGSDDGWADIEKIRTEYGPDRRNAREMTITEVTSGSATAAAPAAPPQIHENYSTSARPVREARKRPRSQSPTDYANGASGGGSSRKTKPKVTLSKPSGNFPPPQPPAVQGTATFSVSKDTFEVGDSVNFAITCLLSLDRGEAEHPSVFKKLKQRLQHLAASLSVLYHNTNYTKMVSDTLQELKSYAGPERPQLPHSKVFLDLLEKHGFCVTPRMFSKSEILCIAIAMLDTRHHYIRILQKTGDERGFRGMAFLDPRVQCVMIKRLQRYGFASSRFHPDSLQTFSSVVINGGGSWLQSSNWEFNLQSRFVMDCTVKPFAIALSDSPGVLESNGLYVASTARRNNKPVYVQVSYIEFEGSASHLRKDKDFIPFKTCLLDSAVTSVQVHALDSQGSRCETCSPRVLCCTGDDSWGIQLMPGFDTAMFVVRFSWDGQTTPTTVAGAQCFQRKLFGGQSNAIMQPCNMSITKVAFEATEIIHPNNQGKRHYFSFGTSKYTWRDIDDDCIVVPEPLEPQSWHGDGPGFYDAAVYTDRGDLKPDAPSCGKRKRINESLDGDKPGRPIVCEADHLSANSWCPLLPKLLKPFLPEQNDISSESWSALGSVFSGTYIETLPAGAKVNRKWEVVDTAGLRVPIPLGCMAPFTFFWRHRGKGDKDTEEEPIKVQAVPIHARPHNYGYCSDARKFPTIDVEAMLEFTSLCSDSAAHNDPGTLLQILECTQTFNAGSAPGHQEPPPAYHEYFASQRELDAYVKTASVHQRREKVVVSPPACVEVREWTIRLGSQSEGQKCVLVQGVSGRSRVQCTVTAADFESEIPLFFGCDGQKYKLCGNASASLQGQSALFKHVELQGMLTSATTNLAKEWCPATLHHLLCLLDIRFSPQATLSINTDNVLVATSGDECHKLLPFYTMGGNLGTDRLMRVYTSRGVGTRIIVPDPYPCLKDWCFVALDPHQQAGIPKRGPQKSRLGFRVFGTLVYHPLKRLEASLNQDYYTTEITGIDSAGVVTTVNDTPYRLQGRPDLSVCVQSIKGVMGRFPDEGSWFSNGNTSIHGVMQEISAFFKALPVVPPGSPGAAHPPGKPAKK